MREFKELIETITDMTKGYVSPVWRFAIIQEPPDMIKWYLTTELMQTSMDKLTVVKDFLYRWTLEQETFYLTDMIVGAMFQIILMERSPIPIDEPIQNAILEEDNRCPADSTCAPPIKHRGQI